MSVQYLSHFDPMVELNFILERCYGRTPEALGEPEAQAAEVLALAPKRRRKEGAR